MEKNLDPFLTKLCDEVTIQEEKKGFFNSLVDNVKANTCLFEWSEKKLSNNIYGEDFIRELVNNSEIFPFIVETFCVSEVYRKKSNEISEKLVKEAEICLSKSEFEKCKQNCSGAILRADVKQYPGSALYQKALLMRSKCFVQMKQYNLAKNDVSIAIRCGILEDNVKILLKEVLGAIKKSPNEDSFNNGNNDSSVPPLGTSSYIDLTETEEMGRFYKASKDIHIGVNLIIEKPYSSYLVQNCFGTHCHHCFKKLEAPIGCPECSTIAFCSETCLDEALSSYHKYECKYIELFIGSGMAILCFVALRIVTQVGLSESLDIYNKYVSKTNEETKIKSESKYDHKAFFKLCTHEKERSSQDYVRRTLMTFFLMKCLKKTFFENSSSASEHSYKVSSEEITIWALLLRGLQLLQFNAHQIMDERNVKEIAYGLFPLTSMMNHQCAPNVNRFFCGKYMIIKALQPIQRGAMIGDSYGPQWGRSLKGGCGHKTEERRRILSSRYWFFCKCITCRQNWPIPPLNTPYVKCLKDTCEGNIINTKHSCDTCDINMKDDQQYKTYVDKLISSLQHIEETLKLENNELKLKDLINHLNDYWKYTRMSCPKVIKAEDILRLIYTKNLSISKLVLH